MASSTAPEDRELEHSKLRHDLEIARAYGEARTDDWAELFVDNGPAVRIVMLFAGSNLETHERELRSLLRHPDQLEVRRTEYSHNELQETLERVRRHVRTAGTFHSLGLGGGRVSVCLAADQEELAASLLAQYGDAVELKVGNFPFPMRQQQTSPGGRPRAYAHSDISLLSTEGLDVALSDDFVVESGRTGKGSLEFTNRGVNDMTLNTSGAITGRVVDPHTGEVVGGYVGAQQRPCGSSLSLAVTSCLCHCWLERRRSDENSASQYHRAHGRWTPSSMFKTSARGELPSCPSSLSNATCTPNSGAVIVASPALTGRESMRAMSE
jgi:hypothetical protein